MREGGKASRVRIILKAIDPQGGMVGRFGIIILDCGLDLGHLSLGGLLFAGIDEHEVAGPQVELASFRLFHLIG